MPIVVPSNVNFEAVDIAVDLNAYAYGQSKCHCPKLFKVAASPGRLA